GNIPHPSLRISVFHMNDKFIVKFEAGPMEQVYKFGQDKVSGMADIEKIVDETFITNVTKRFRDMIGDMQDAWERRQQAAGQKDV
ncbi:MAG TPA: hypothetical protein VFU15_17385, partial [Bacteroidia bacterium]|nr:hypothetical protein [Bacteroidia bacterium]